MATAQTTANGTITKKVTIWSNPIRPQKAQEKNPISLILLEVR